MINDSFKIRYKTVPLAISIQQDNEETLSHNHSEFEIIKIENGSCLITINDNVYIAGKGDIIFINPFEVHSIKVSENTVYCHKCICFDCSVVINKDIVCSLQTENLNIIHIVKTDNKYRLLLAEHFDNIISCYENDDAYSAMEITSHISLMFAILLKNGFISNNIQKHKNTLFCKNVIDYISEHYNENITSQKTSDALSYNQSYFCRAFKKNFNMCFSDYLNMYRIKTSRMLLEEGQKSISDIALECGFNSPSYFTSCFKKYLGILPSEYK